MNRRRTGTAAAAVALLLAGCGGESDTGAGETPAPVEPATENQVQSEMADGQRMTQEDLGDEWPLTVDAVTVRCEGGGQVLAETDDGTLYAVNGEAMAQRPELPDVDEVWAGNPDPNVPKMSLSPLITAGLEDC